jgi:hypothetical protein
MEVIMQGIIVGIFLTFMLTAIILFQVIKVILYKNHTILDILLGIVLVVFALIF